MKYRSPFDLKQASLGVFSRKPTVDVAEALAYTAPGIVAHQSALKGGELLKIPQFDG